MRRAAAILALVAALGAFVAFTAGFGGGQRNTYQVELDNAFGLIEGGDLKVAGVRAGQITKIALDRRTRHALVGFRIDRSGFGSLRADVHCESRPQSLIGEYYLDCLPGTSPKRLKPGARIPVTQTASTIAPDLVQDVLREPQRDRLRIIVSELGAGVAGRGPELNAAIRRSIPALRETDKTLELLGRQNQLLADLAVNADKVVGDLAANRKDVGRFVETANDTAQASAERRPQLASGLQRLPGFLEQLKPTMKSLGEVADRQTPALEDLDASAPQLTRFLDLLAPFAQASRPAIRSLGQASLTGDKAAKDAPPTVSLLNGFAAGTPEVGKDLAIVLEHLDDRKNAIEKDPRSPGGEGYTGLEALLQYVYDQAESTAIYDQNSHIFKVALFASKCANYADAEAVKKDATLAQDCGSYLGPNQPGINIPDVTRFEDPNSDTAKAQSKHRSDPTLPKPPALPELPKAPVEPAPAPPSVPGVGGGGGVKPPPVEVPQTPKLPAVPPAPAVPSVPSVPNAPVPCVAPLQPPACDPNLALPPGASPPPGVTVPSVTTPVTPNGTPPVTVPVPGHSASASAPAAAAQPASDDGSRQLLDYLMAP